MLLLFREVIMQDLFRPSLLWKNVSQSVSQLSMAGGGEARLTLSERLGTPWTGHQFIAGLPQRQPTIHTLIQTQGQFRAAT